MDIIFQILLICINYSLFPILSAHLSRLSTLDTSWVAAATAGAGLGLQSTASHPAWLSVYLGVCKLLDQVLTWLVTGVLKFNFNTFRLLLFLQIFCLSFKCIAGHL